MIAAAYLMAYPGYEGYGAADPYGYGGSYGASSYAAPMGVPHGYGGDELRTVFITGFPGDVKERELNNLLRFLPGYEASQMNFGKGQVGRKLVKPADHVLLLVCLNCTTADPGTGFCPLRHWIYSACCMCCSGRLAVSAALISTKLHC